MVITFGAWLLEQIKRQGLSMGLLAIAIMYFNDRQQVLEMKLEKAQLETVAYLREDRQNLMSLMVDNKKVMEDTKEVIKRIEKRLR